MAMTIESAPLGSTALLGSMKLPSPRKTKLSWVLNLLLLYLAGITIFGKGPTYIGLEPIFWGEPVLFICLVWTLRRWHRVALRTGQARALTLLVCGFILVGTAETIIDYPIWGIDALRDSAVWYYSLFYFVGLVIASSAVEWEVFTSRWKLFWLLAIPWCAAELLSGDRFSTLLSPTLPGSRGALLLSGSSSDIAQSLGLGCLLLVSERTFRWRLLSTFPRTLVCLAGLMAVAAYRGRGARLAVLAAFVVFGVISFSKKTMGLNYRRRLVAIGILGVAAVTAAIVSDVDLMRRLNFDRFGEAGILEGTNEWRTEWWKGLYSVVLDRNPSFGLGFGDNLISYNPLIGDPGDTAPARAPHNYNVTVFARMGMVGTCIWIGILLFGLMIPFWKATRTSTALEREIANEHSFWIAALFACWVNSSFGVLMEGPVLGIPFWLILGMIAAHPRGFGQQVFVKVDRPLEAA